MAYDQISSDARMYSPSCAKLTAKNCGCCEDTDTIHHNSALPFFPRHKNTLFRLGSIPVRVSGKNPTSIPQDPTVYSCGNDGNLQSQAPLLNDSIKNSSCGEKPIFSNDSRNEHLEKSGLADMFKHGNLQSNLEQEYYPIVYFLAAPHCKQCGADEHRQSDNSQQKQGLWQVHHDETMFMQGQTTTNNGVPSLVMQPVRTVSTFCVIVFSPVKSITSEALATCKALITTACQQRFKCIRIICREDSKEFFYKFETESEIVVINSILPSVGENESADSMNSSAFGLLSFLNFFTKRNYQGCLRQVLDILRYSHVCMCITEPTCTSTISKGEWKNLFLPILEGVKDISIPFFFFGVESMKSVIMAQQTFTPKRQLPFASNFCLLLENADRLHELESLLQSSASSMLPPNLPSVIDINEATLAFPAQVRSVQRVVRLSLALNYFQVCLVSECSNLIEPCWQDSVVRLQKHIIVSNGYITFEELQPTVSYKNRRLNTKSEISFSIFLGLLKARQSSTSGDSLSTVTDMLGMLSSRRGLPKCCYSAFYANENANWKEGITEQVPATTLQSGFYPKQEQSNWLSLIPYECGREVTKGTEHYKSAIVLRELNPNTSTMPQELTFCMGLIKHLLSTSCNYSNDLGKTMPFNTSTNIGSNASTCCSTPVAKNFSNDVMAHQKKHYVRHPPLVFDIYADLFSKLTPEEACCIPPLEQHPYQYTHVTDEEESFSSNKRLNVIQRNLKALIDSQIINRILTVAYVYVHLAKNYNSGTDGCLVAKQYRTNVQVKTVDTNGSVKFENCQTEGLISYIPFSSINESNLSYHPACNIAASLPEDASEEEELNYDQLAIKDSVHSPVAKTKSEKDDCENDDDGFELYYQW